MRIIEDQYTRGLMGSRHIATVIAALSAAARSSDASALEQGAHDLRSKGNAWLDELDRVGDLRSHPGYVNKVAIAGPGAGCCPPGPNTNPMCTRDGRRLCDYDAVGVRTGATAGNAIFNLSPQPAAGFTRWRPKLVHGFAFDSGNPSVPRWEGLFVTNITVGQHPVVGYSTAAAAGVLDGQPFADWVTPDPAGVPVGWPDFTPTALQRALVISGIGLWNVGITFIAQITIYGNPIDDDQNCEKRCNPGSTPVPPMGGSNNYASAGSGVR